MSNIVISAQGLGKEYRIGHVQSQRNFRESLTGAFLGPFQKVGRLLRGQAAAAAGLEEVFWALRDIDFEISRGEVVGIIGRNGAGKSTLLKILSRITEPSEGYAEIRGRVASLLEVGTGFHPELTGRENIFLNGSILGMRRAEILRDFDEIVAFAEVERFIDTPIKHYSSGMAVRLAFAVAAHLEPEILIVDEVLAVGDARFQRKCLDKMESVGEQGRTVLFVSHNMPAVTRMCPRILLVQEGRLVMDGPAADVAAAYMSSDSGTPAERTWNDVDSAPGNQFVSLRAVRVRTVHGEVGAGIDIRDPVTVEIEYEVLQGGHKLLPHLWFCNEEGVLAFGSFDLDPTWLGKPRPAGHYQGSVKIPGNFFAEGLVFVNCAMNCLETKSVMFDEKEVVAFQVTDTQDGDSSRGLWTGRFPGVVRPKLDWVNEFQANEELVTRRRTVGAG